MPFHGIAKAKCNEKRKQKGGCPNEWTIPFYKKKRITSYFNLANASLIRLIASTMFSSEVA